MYYPYILYFTATLVLQPVVLDSVTYRGMYRYLFSKYSRLIEYEIIYFTVMFHAYIFLAKSKEVFIK